MPKTPIAAFTRVRLHIQSAPITLPCDGSRLETKLTGVDLHIVVHMV